MKEKIREEYFLKRANHPDDENELKSIMIKEKLFSLPEFKKAGTVMFYYSFGSEVKTTDMIKEAFDKKTVVVPKIKENKKMDPIEINESTELEENSVGITEPVSSEIIDKKDIDMIIIPAIAFDIIGHRVGYGHGFYDRFLQDMNAIKVGVAFDFQITNTIPPDAHDVKVDYVITEKRVIKYGKN